MNFKQHVDELKKFDFSSPDIDDIGNWPLLIRLTILAVVFISLLILGWFYYLVDSYDAIEQVKRSIVDKKVEFERRYPESSNLDDYHDQMVRIEAMFNELVSKLPTNAEVPTLLRSIDDAARDNNLKLEDIKPIAEKNMEHYTEMPYQLVVTGGYHNMGLFVAKVAALSRIVTMHDFTVVSEARNDHREMLRMNVLVKTYLNKRSDK